MFLFWHLFQRNTLSFLLFNYDAKTDKNINKNRKHFQTLLFLQTILVLTRKSMHQTELTY